MILSTHSCSWFFSQLLLRLFFLLRGLFPGMHIRRQRKARETLVARLSIEIEILMSDKKSRKRGHAAVEEADDAPLASSSTGQRKVIVLLDKACLETTKTKRNGEPGPLSDSDIGPIFHWTRWVYVVQSVVFKWIGLWAQLTPAHASENTYPTDQ